MARAASFQGGEKYSSGNNSKYNKQRFLFCSLSEPMIFLLVFIKVTRIMHMQCDTVTGSDWSGGQMSWVSYGILRGFLG